MAPPNSPLGARAPLDGQQVRRYARHILLPDVGGIGQQHLLDSAVAVSLPAYSPAEIAALAYLAAAGVGCLVIDGAALEPVDVRDVQSGILYRQADIGRSRVDALHRRIEVLNPDVHITLAADAPDQAERAVTLVAAEPPWPGVEADVAGAIALGALRAARTLSLLLESRHRH